MEGGISRISFRKSHYIDENATVSGYIIPREGGVFASFRHHGGGSVLPGRGFLRARGGTLRPDAGGVGGGRGIGSSFMIYGPPNIGKTMLLLKLGKVLATAAGVARASPPVPVLLLLQPDPLAPAGALPAFPAGVPGAAAPVLRRRAPSGLRPGGDVRAARLLRVHRVPGGSRGPRAVHRRGGRPLRARERALVSVLGVGGALLPGVPARRLPVHGETPGRARRDDAFHPAPLHQEPPTSRCSSRAPPRAA